MFRSDPLQQPDAKISSSASTSGLMNILAGWQPTYATLVIIAFWFTIKYTKGHLSRAVAIDTLQEDDGSIMN